MTTADRVYAAEQLLAFLERVGPREAVWAMTTALEALQDDRTGDHLQAVVRAFDEAVTAEKLAALQLSGAATTDGEVAVTAPSPMATVAAPGEPAAVVDVAEKKKTTRLKEEDSAK